MKNKYIYTLSLLIVILSSCDAFLTTPPLDQIPDGEWWKNEKEVQMTVNDCYNKLPSASDLVESDFKRTDNGMHRHHREVANGSYTAYSGEVRKEWKYDHIARFNYVLEGIERSKNIISEAVYSKSKSEVRFLRAYTYYYMLFHFGDIPLIKRVITPAESKETTRQPRQEVLNFVLTELHEVLEDLATFEPQEKGRVNRDVVNAFLARIYLYEGQFNQVLKYTQAVIDSGKYELFRKYDNVTGKNSYEELFRPQADKENREVIFEKQYLAPQVVHSLNRSCSYSSSIYKGWIELLPLQELVSEYECLEGHSYADCERLNCQYVQLRAEVEEAGKKPGEYEYRDPRLQGTIITPGWQWKVNGVVQSTYGVEDPTSKDYIQIEPHSTGFLLTKWIDLLGVEEDRTRGDKNITLIRYADILLMHAEALIETNQKLEEAVSLLNTIRNRAGLPENIVLTNQETLRKQLRKERRVETAFEGLRFFDIIRWGIGQEVQDKEVYGFAMKDLETGEREHIFMEKRIWKDAMYQWPIPQAAIDVNNNLTQNTGW